MSNTLIQIKRSTTTATPPNGSLAAGQEAYSYSSNTLFIGTPDGTGVIAIGGKYYIDTIGNAYDQANNAFSAANAANSGSVSAGAFAQANSASATANAAIASANAALATGNAAFAVANAAIASANAALATGNAAYAFANSTSITANLAFIHANNAYNMANNALPKTGGTISGDLVVTGNTTFSGLVTYANTQTLLVGDNIFVLNADLPAGAAPSEDAGMQINRGSSPNVGIIWNESTDKWTMQIADGTYKLLASNTDVETITASGAAAFTVANAAFLHANAAFIQANAAIASASAGQATANAAFAAANGAFASANAGQSTANASYAFANSAHRTANLAFTHANNAYALANSATAQAANADFLTTGTVPSGRLSGSYTGITGLGTITTGVWQGSTVAVGYGGTGQTTFTTNGILYGNGSGALNVTAAGTEGQVLQASSTGIPQFGMLDGGTF